MSRYNDGSGYICDSEQEEDWFDNGAKRYAVPGFECHVFAQLMEDGQGGLKAVIKMYTDRHPTVSHMAGAHFFLFTHHGADWSEARSKSIGYLVQTFPGLKVSHG